MKRRNKLFAFVGICLIALLLFGCSSSTPAKVSENKTTGSTETSVAGTSTGVVPGSLSTPVTGKTFVVLIKDFAFNPNELTIAKGDTVVFKNEDSAPHVVASATNVFESDQLGNGASWSYYFTETGSFDYYCKIHPSMKGRIVVK